MSDQNIPENLDLRFDKTSNEEAPQAPRQHAEVGWSSLYGRIGDNLTYHCCSRDDTTPTRMWGWVWKDLTSAFINLFKLFSFRLK